jgi:cytochrome oxidase assembly protein ShyY1
MRSPLLRPRWIVGHLLAGTAIVSFIFLGTWQLRRHDEKVVLRAAVQVAIDTPAVPIEEVPDGAFATVWATGEYVAEPEARVLRSRDGVSGYEVLTPFLLSDGSAVLVDRGWAGLDVDHRVGGSAPTGVIKIGGILWPGEEGSTIPEQMSEYVRRIDPVIFAAFSPLEFRPEYLVLTEQGPQIEGILKIPEVGEVSLGPHLGYAGQWFLFAAVVLVGYPLLLKRRIGSASNQESAS